MLTLLHASVPVASSCWRRVQLSKLRTAGEIAMWLRRRGSSAQCSRIPPDDGPVNGRSVGARLGLVNGLSESASMNVSDS